jgi:hypothetical protein
MAASFRRRPHPPTPNPKFSGSLRRDPSWLRRLRVAPGEPSPSPPRRAAASLAPARPSVRRGRGGGAGGGIRAPARRGEELQLEGERSSGEKEERQTATAARVRRCSRDRLAAPCLRRQRTPTPNHKGEGSMATVVCLHVARKKATSGGRCEEKKRISGSNTCGPYLGERVSPVNRGHGHPVVSCFGGWDLLGRFFLIVRFFLAISEIILYFWKFLKYCTVIFAGRD